MKKEKYIEIRKGKKGTTFRVKIELLGVTYSESFSEYLYGSKQLAFKAAIMARDQALIDIRNNRFTVNCPKVSELYEETKTTFNLSMNTIKSHDNYFNKYIKEQFGDMTLDSIKTSDLQAWINEVSQIGTDMMVKRCMNIWRGIYKVANQQGYNVNDCTNGIIIPEAWNTTKKRFSEVEISDFLAFLDILPTIPNEERRNVLYYASMAMFYLGLSLHEGLGLLPEDIDLKANTVTISRSMGSTPTEESTYTTLKNKYRYRTIPIPTGTEQFFTDLKNYLPFTWNGKPATNDQVSHYVKDLCQRKKINFRLSALRHLFSTQAFKAGVSPVTIQKLMGHATPNMSAYYAYVTDSDKKQAIDSFSQNFSQDFKKHDK